jgi:hypothetical protein
LFAIRGLSRPQAVQKVKKAKRNMKGAEETLKERGPAGEIFHLGQGGCYFWRDEPRKSIT